MPGSRYANYLSSLLLCSKPEVAFLANLSVDDHKTVLGWTMARLKKELDVYVIITGIARRKIKYFPVPRLEEWRLNILVDLCTMSMCI